MMYPLKVKLVFGTGTFPKCAEHKIYMSRLRLDVASYRYASQPTSCSIEVIA
jgi:hypothetical protein